MKLYATLFLIIFYKFIVCEEPCLHNGCELSPGLKIQQVDGVLSGLLRPTEFKDNVITAISWDIRQAETSSRDYQWKTSKKDVCRYLTRLNPNFLGFQDVNPSQLAYIKLCMGDHTILKDKRNNDKPFQNILVMKNTRRLKIKDYGSFTATGSLKPVDPSSYLWAKINFAHRLTTSPQFSLSYTDKPRESLVKKLFDLLNLLLPQRNHVNYRQKRNARVRRKTHARYRWSTLYVAVAKINSDSEVSAKNQLQEILMHFRNKVMKRRRYPLILLADIGKESNSLAYSYLLKNRHWLRNTMVHSMKTFPATTTINENDPSSELNADYVFKHRLHSLVAATLTDDVKTMATHRPVLSALLRFR